MKIEGFFFLNEQIILQLKVVTSDEKTLLVPIQKLNSLFTSYTMKFASNRKFTKKSRFVVRDGLRRVSPS